MKAIQTKYLPSTDYRGSRIKAIAEGGDKPHTITIPYPHELSGMDCHALAAVELCRKMNWGGVLIGGGLPDTYVFVFLPHGAEVPDDAYGAYSIDAFGRD